jgi:hypothetical protein
MERKNLDAGKKAAEELAPEPIEHTPEAPIISEDEAQVIESPDTDTDTRDTGKSAGNIADKVLDRDDDTIPDEGSVRIHPKHDR